MCLTTSCTCKGDQHVVILIASARLVLPVNVAIVITTKTTVVSTRVPSPVFSRHPCPKKEKGQLKAIKVSVKPVSGTVPAILPEPGRLSKYQRPRAVNVR